MLYFITDNFHVACYCNKIQHKGRSHYHCPYCKFRPITRGTVFRKDLKGIHGKNEKLYPQTFMTSLSTSNVCSNV